jgi:transposase
MQEMASLAESDRKIALDRYRILRPHLEDGRALSVVASEAGVAYSTAQRWVSLYRRFGLSALVRKRRSDRGQRRARPDARDRARPADPAQELDWPSSWSIKPLSERPFPEELP